MSTELSDSELFRQLLPTISDTKGRRYQEFRKTLVPRYWRAWLQIGLGWLVLLAFASGLFWLGKNLSPMMNLALGLAGAFPVGFALGFLNLWLHEASHFNLHWNRDRNDLICNILLGPLVGQTAATYRAVHMEHHKRLGETLDPENSYFYPLNLRYIFFAITGLQVLEMFSRYGATQKQKAEMKNRMLPATAMMHVGVCVGAWLLGSLALAVAWLLGAGVVLPFLTSLRSKLEHRNPALPATQDCRVVAHGEYTRVFGNGLLDVTFGGAGFNRHLLHHWDPAISCTRFRELERFVEETELGARYRARKTTYIAAFSELVRKA